MTLFNLQTDKNNRKKKQKLAICTSYSGHASTYRKNTSAFFQSPLKPIATIDQVYGKLIILLFKINKIT